MQQQTTKAISFYQQSLEIREHALGRSHPKTMATRRIYARLVQEMRQTEGQGDLQRRGCQTKETCSPLHQAGPASSSESNALQGFLDVCCELHPRARCRSADLWQAYERWVKAQQERYPLSRWAFITQLKAHGCHAGRTKIARIWYGITLMDKHDDRR
jgi:uncharacterized protein YjiS (DUF1127 family)